MIETSHEPGVIGLWNNGESLNEVRLSTRNRAQNLVIAIRDMFREGGFKPRDCTQISVGIGPGSFTGLRVGIVCAKTLAYACECPVAAIPTLRGLAENAPANVSRGTCVVDAQRQEVFAQTFEREAAGTWKETGEIRILPFVTWGSELTPADAVLGPALEEREELLARKCRVLDRTLWQPSGKSLAKLGALHEFQRTCWDVLPLYVRKSAAEEKWDALRAT
ncbi:MAG: tRNA (adenosine(37)-N6)-threonylcarbamoyltransferase complex dimerization subunit type 1 TsaB [Planctomycetales bacterium]